MQFFVTLLVFDGEVKYVQFDGYFVKKVTLAITIYV